MCVAVSHTVFQYLMWNRIKGHYYYLYNKAIIVINYKSRILFILFCNEDYSLINDLMQQLLKLMPQILQEMIPLKRYQILQVC